MIQRRPRVLLVTAPYHSGVVESAGVWLPLNFVYVAGAARAAGAEVRIHDAMSLFASHEDIAKVIEEFRPDLVGTTAITATEPDCRVICETAKRWNPAVKTLVDHTNALHKALYPSGDNFQDYSNRPALDVLTSSRRPRP